MSYDLRLAETVLENKRDAVVALDPDLRVLSWNEVMAELSGIPAHEAVGQSLFHLFPRLRDSKAERTIRTGLAGNTMCESPPFFGAKDPTTAHNADWFVVPSYDHGHVSFACVVARTRTPIEERWAESEQRFRQMADSAPVLLWMSGLDGKCTFFNSTWLEFTGRPLEEELGDRWAEGIHPEDFELCMTTYMQAFTQREPFEMEYRLRRHDGEFRWILDRGMPRHTSSGIFSGYIGSCIDITDRREAEQEGRRLAQELKLANEHMQRILYAASHDLREPLRNVRTFLDQIERSFGDRLDERTRRYVHHAQDGADRMRRLVDGLLEFARTRQQHLDETEVDLNQLVRHVLSSLAAAIEEASAKVEVSPLPTLRGDATLLGRLLQNLIDNALKFRGELPPRIRISAELSGTECLLCVEDDGIGFDADYAEHMFEIFSRLERRESYRGSGIGLAIVKEIVERHGGRLWAQSKPGEGARFFIGLKRTARGSTGPVAVS